MRIWLSSYSLTYTSLIIPGATQLQSCTYFTNIFPQCLISISTSFIQSFIHSGHFYRALQGLYYSEALPTTARILYRSFGNRQLQVKDLPKVPTWRLERESNPRPSGWKSSSQPRRHHVPSLIFPQSSIQLNMTSHSRDCEPRSVLWTPLSSIFNWVGDYRCE